MKIRERSWLRISDNDEFEKRVNGDEIVDYIEKYDTTIINEFISGFTLLTKDNKQIRFIEMYEDEYGNFWDYRCCICKEGFNDVNVIDKHKEICNKCINNE